MSKFYNVSEIFYSIQGEGSKAGTPAVFVRMAGCNLKCPWCDTDHTLRNVYTKKQIVNRIKSEMDAVGVLHVPLVVITGGEPMLQYDLELHEAIEASKRTDVIAVETNGTIDIPPELMHLFVTCSPKSIGSLKIDPRRPNEVKVILTKDSIAEEAYNYFSSDVPKFIQPCWYPNDPEACRQSMNDAVTFSMQWPVWRLSLQTQKLARFL